MSAFVGVRIDVVRLSEYDENGFLGFQYDGFGEQASGVPAIEAMHTQGFFGRPLDPTLDAGGNLVHGCQMLRFGEGDKTFAVALHDARIIPALAQVRPGESVQYGPKNNFVRCHDDGRISQMCTDDGTENGKVIASEQGPNGWGWRGPWGKLTHDALGLHYLHASGARIDGGAISGLPAPLSALGSYWTIQAQVISLKGTAVMVGSGAYDPAAKATATLAVLSPVVTALQAVQAALAALVGIPSNSAAGAAVGAAAVAVAAAVTALGTGTVAIPARSVQVA